MRPSFSLISRYKAIGLPALVIFIHPNRAMNLSLFHFQTRRITSYSSGEAKLVKSTGTEADTGKGGDTNADQTTTTVETGSAPSAEHREPVTTADEQLTRDFLSGDYCLTGVWNFILIRFDVVKSRRAKLSLLSLRFYVL